MLKQKFLVQFGSNISLRILGLVSGIFVARIAGPEVIGTIAFATAYVGIFAFIIGVLGTGNIKLISEGEDIGDSMATYTKLQLISISIFIISVLGWFFIQKYMLNNNFENREQEQVIIITLFTVVITKLVQFNTSTFTGQLKQVKANLPNIVRGILFQLGKIVVVILGFRAVGIASWNLITAIIVLPISIKLFRSLSYGKFNKVLAKKHFKIAAPILLIVALNSFIAYSDRLILQYYTNSTELGYFAVAFSLGGMILILGNTMGIVFFPLFSKMIKENDWESINQKIKKFEIFIANFIFPFICLLALIAEPLLITLLGEKYEPSVIPFGFLLFASYATIVGMPYGNVLSGMGKFYLNFWLKLAKFVFYIIVVIILISPSFLGLGAVGLAINLLLANIFHNTLIFLASKKIGNISFNLGNILRYIIILVITMISYYYKSNLKDLSQYWWLFFIPVYSIGVYGVLFLTNLLTRSQVVELLGLINPKITYKYIKKEINE